MTVSDINMTQPFDHFGSLFLDRLTRIPPVDGVHQLDFLSYVPQIASASLFLYVNCQWAYPFVPFVYSHP